MTFDDDMIRFNFDGGIKMVTCISAKIEWPPPKKINIMGITMERKGMSTITDKQRREMTNIIRGAEYYIIRGAEYYPITKGEKHDYNERD